MLILAKNAAMLLASQFCAQGLTFLTVAIIARNLSVADFGHLSFSLIYARLLMGIVDIGVRKVQVRDMASDTARSMDVSRYVPSKFILAIAATLITLTLQPWITKGSPDATTLWAALAAFIASLGQVYIAGFQAHNNFRPESISQVVRALLLLFSSLFICINTPASFAFAYATSELGALGAVVYLWVRSSGTAKLTWDIAHCLRIGRRSFAFGISGAFEMIYHWLDSVMLQRMAGPAQVGLYSAAYRIFTLTLQFPSVAGNVMYPLMSRDYAETPSNVLRSQREYFRHLLAFGTPLFLALILFSEVLLAVVFGSNYAPAAVPLKILAGALLLILFNSPFVKALEAGHQQNKLAILTGAAAMMNVALNILLIPSKGIVGAAIATVASESLITLGAFCLCAHRWDYNWHQWITDALRVAICCVAAVGAASIPMPPLAAGLFGLFTYSVAVIATGAVNHERIGSAILALVQSKFGLLRAPESKFPPNGI